MKKLLIGLAASLCLAGLAFSAPQPASGAKKDAGAKKEEAPKNEDAPKSDDAAKQDEGHLVFETARCWMCHSIEGHGNKKTPLDGVGARLTADQIRKWIVSPREMKSDTIMKSFSGLAKNDLEALVAYLASLKPRAK